MWYMCIDAPIHALMHQIYDAWVGKRRKGVSYLCNCSGKLDIII